MRRLAASIAIAAAIACCLVATAACAAVAPYAKFEDGMLSKTRPVAMAAAKDSAVQDVPYGELSSRLSADGQITGAKGGL